MLIDDEDFSLGIPTPEQMFKLHAVLLENECEQLTRELGHARRRIAQLVLMNDEFSNECAKLKASLEEKCRQLSVEYVRNSKLSNVLRCSGIVSLHDDHFETAESYETAMAKSKAYAARTGRL